MESQIRHIHALDFVQVDGYQAEYRCKQCAEVFYQVEECL